METLITIAELAALLKVTEAAVRKWVLKKEIPYHKLGKLVRFRPVEIECWVDGGSMGACMCDGAEKTKTTDEGMEVQA